MALIAGEIVLERPIDEVFAFVADERNEPRFNPRMLRAEKLTDGPVGLGTRFLAVMRTGRRTTEMTIEITGYEPPRLLASATRMPGMAIGGALTFDPVPGGTRMRWAWHLRPTGALRLATPLVALIGRRRERATWTGLKRLLEGA